MGLIARVVGPMLMKEAFPWERDGATKGEGASVLMMEMELLKMAEIDAGMASKLSVIGVRDCVICPSSCGAGAGFVACYTR